MKNLHIVSGRSCAPSGIFGIFGIRVCTRVLHGVSRVERTVQVCSAECSQQPWEENASVSRLVLGLKQVKLHTIRERVWNAV